MVCGFEREGVWVWIDLGEKETTIESASIEDSCCCFHGETPSTISRFHLKVAKKNIFRKSNTLFCAEVLVLSGLV